MNLQEFAALKVGDKIQNLALGSHIGVVSEVTDRGVKVKWPPSSQEHFFSAAGTAWFQWSKADDSAPSIAP